MATLVGNIRGTTGVVGPTGVSGPIGVTGASGPSGPSGPAPTSGAYVHAGTAVNWLGGAAIAANQTGYVQWTASPQLSGFTQNAGGDVFTCQQAGRYRVEAILSLSGTSGDAYSLLYILKNGSITLQNSIGEGPGWYNQGVVQGFLDLAVGDTVRIGVGMSANVAAGGVGLDVRSNLTITPVGGVKGDPGATGPDATLAQSSFFNAQISGASANLPTATPTAAAWTNNVTANGFTTANGGVNIVASQAGRYRCTAEISIYAGNAASNWNQGYIRQYSAANALLAERTFVGGFGSFNEQVVVDAVFNMAAGDYLQVLLQPGQATTQYDTRTWVTVVPVGGTKGDTGATGASGGPLIVGGTTGQVLAKQSATDLDVVWGNALGPIVTAATDFNALTTTGLYSIARDATNGPMTGWPTEAGVCTVIVAPSGDILQTWQNIANAHQGQTWQRARVSNTWQQWIRAAGVLDYALSGKLAVSPYNATGGGDTNIWQYVAPLDGYMEILPGVIHYGYCNGALSSASAMFYTNSVSGAPGGALQTPSVAGGGLGAGTWGRMNPPANFIVPVSKGGTYVITFRFGYAPTNITCYLDTYFSYKFMAGPT